MTYQPDIYTVERPDGSRCTLDYQFSEIEALSGAPDIRIAFTELPSINDYLGTSRFHGAAAGLIKKWRGAGAKQIIKQLETNPQGWPYQIDHWSEFETSDSGRTREVMKARFAQPVFTRCKLIVRYWRPTKHRYDTFSPFIKPVVDGFVDAGFVEDDDQTRITSSQIDFMGFDSSLKLSEEAREKRTVKRKFRKASLLTPSRFWFDFYNLAK